MRSSQLAEVLVQALLSSIGYILGLYWDNGKENENYKVYMGYIWVI